ncbi:hypothetical protein GCM10028805_60190 [Spirosoma harenae]
MKKILILGFLFLASLTSAQAQTAPLSTTALKALITKKLTPIGLRKITPDSIIQVNNALADAIGVRPLTLATVASLSLTPGQAGQSVIVNHPTQGGTFTWYAAGAGYSVDNGVVFPAPNNTFWVRQYVGPTNAGWFDLTGSVAILSTIIDKYPNLQLAPITYTGPLSVTASGVRIQGSKAYWNGTTVTGGTILNGSITVYGNKNEISQLGITNASGNGVVIRDNASDNKVENVIFAVQNHGVLMEQFGGTAKGNVIKSCDAYGGIHGFVSKSANAVFTDCRSFSASVDGFALVSDNITGTAYPSICINNKLINCEAYSGNSGIVIYSRDYSSTTNTNNIQLTSLAIIGGTIDGMSAYGIRVGDEATGVPGGNTWNDVRNITINSVSINNVTTQAIKYLRSNGVVTIGSQFTSNPDKSSTVAKNLTFLANAGTNFSMGNLVYNTVLTLNSTSPSVDFGDTYYETQNTVSTVISAITGGKVGKVVWIYINDDYTVFSQSSTLDIRRFVGGKGSILVLKYNDAGNKWVELFSTTVRIRQFWPYQSSLSLDYRFGRFMQTYLTGDVASLVFTNLPRDGEPFELLIHGSGTRTIGGWDSRIIWFDGKPPVLLAASQILILRFMYEGTNIYCISKQGDAIRGAVQWTPGTITNGTTATTSFTLAGARVGYFQNATFLGDLQGCKTWARVTADNTVSVYIENTTGSDKTIGNNFSTVELRPSN